MYNWSLPKEFYCAHLALQFLVKLWLYRSGKLTKTLTKRKKLLNKYSIITVLFFLILYVAHLWNVLLLYNALDGFEMLPNVS